MMLDSQPWRERVVSRAAWIRVAWCGLGALCLMGLSMRASQVSPSHELELHAGSAVSDEQACVSCHQDIVSTFATTGHRLTLNAADAPDLQSLFATSSDAPHADLRETFARSGGSLVARSTKNGRKQQVDWIFGSGRHARTPVSTWLLADQRLELLEHAVSWYPQTGLAPTIGLEHKESSGEGMNAMGVVHSRNAAENCFGCHSTAFPQSPSGPNWERHVAGVRCARCHVAADKHAIAAAAGETRIESWSHLSPLESVNRCGECHRRSDHFPLDELRPNNAQLLRFASVGLVESLCFREQHQIDGQRLDCMSCHDPHRPLDTDVSRSLRTCAQCHSEVSRACSQAPRTSNCLPCHMPKTAISSSLQFTNHWIQRRPQAAK